MNYRQWTVILVAVLILLAPDCLAAEVENKPVALYNVSTVEELLAAVSKIGPDGGTIVLAPGNYRLEQTITINNQNHINITGSGWNTAIQKIGDGDVFVFDNSGFCTVRNLLMNGDGNAKTGSGIVFKGAHKSSSCNVDYCRISNFPVSGIRFEGDKEKPLSTNTVSNCHFIGNRQEQLYSQHNNDFYIRGNQFGTHSEHPRIGCLLDHSSAGTYTQNYHWNNAVAFKLGPNSHFNRIEINRFEESDETGVIIGDKSGSCYLNIVTGNTFHTNSKNKLGGFPAINATNAVDTTFCTNQVFSWDSEHYKHKNSLVVGDGCKNWIVKDNIFRHNTEEPVVYDENAGHIVKDNMM